MGIFTGSIPLTRSQWSAGLSLLLVALAASLAALASYQPWVDPRLLFMDTPAAAEASGYCCRVYYGVMSHLGVVAWFLTAGASLFAALCLWSRGSRGADWRVLAAAGILSLVLGLDDLLLLHELVLPRLGIPQNVVLAAYVLLGGAYALLQRRRLLAREGAFLTLAFGLFALSLGTDIALHSIDSAVVMAEDGFKFVGIVSWMAFHVALAERFASRI